MLDTIKTWARALKRDSRAIYLAARDPRVPWHVKLLAVAVAGYALSPIDLIPDFIPVIGYLDDLVLVPLGIWLVIALVPKEVMVECRAKAETSQPPTSRAATVIIILVWIGAALALGWVAYSRWA